MAATPKDDKCNMKIMRKHVVNKLSPYWSVVCQHLGYSTADLQENDKKNLITVLEHWINSGQKEGRPKTWSMFIGVLSNISELSTVTSDIYRNLNTAGVYITPPNSSSHDPSPRQSQRKSHSAIVPQLVQDNTSSLTEVADGGTNQSTAGVAAATPPHNQCNIKAIHKHVASHLSPHWIMVCHHLGYSTAQRDRFRSANDKKSLIAVLEHWIKSGEKEGKPRTWSMLIGVLSNISELSTVTSDICRDLNTAGIYITPPTSKSHDLSPKQSQSPQLVQDVTSSLTEVADGPNKSTNGQLTHPTEKPLNMQMMYRHVVSKLSPYWTSVGDYLEYSVTERNNFKGPNNNKSLAALLENWITTTNGRQPKTWSTFFKVLRELDEDLSMSVGREICASIQAELAPPSTPVQQPPPRRIASYSSSPAQHPQKHVKVTQSFSVPTVNAPNQYSRPSVNDVRVKLENQFSIPEENFGLPSQGGQPHGSLHQSPHVSRFASPYVSSATGHPPAPSYSPSTGQQHLVKPSYQSFNQYPWGYPPGQHYPSMPQGPPSISQGPPSMSQGLPSMAHQSIGYLRGHLSRGYLQGHPSMGHYSPRYPDFHPSKQGQVRPQATQQHYQHKQPGDPQQSPRQPIPSQLLHEPSNQQNLSSNSQSTQFGHLQERQQQQGIQSHGHTVEQQPNTQPIQYESTQQQMSLSHASHHGVTNTSTSKQVDKRIISINEQQQSSPAANLKQEERKQLYFTEVDTPMNNPVTCADDKLYYEVQEQLQARKQDQLHSNSQDLTDHHKVTGYRNSGSAVASEGGKSDSNDQNSVATCTARSSAAVAMTTVTNSIATIKTTASSSVMNAATNVIDDSSVTTTTSATPTTSPAVTTVPTNGNRSTDSDTTTTNAPEAHGGKVFNVSLTVEQVTSKNQSSLDVNASSATAAPAVAAPFQWKRSRRLGRGAFGEVFMCKDEDNDRLLAVKEVWTDPNNSSETRKAVESLEKEIQFLKNLKHDRIVQYYGTERSETCVRIFMEYMPGGSLYQHIDEFGALKEQRASKYTRQLLEGVKYLHVKRIVHRDIKGANILMDLSGHVKIADFGGSKLLRSIYLSSRMHERQSNTKSIVGTAYWMAPEVIRGETVDQRADIWSIGCTLVEMLTRYPPYHHLNTFAAMYKIGGDEPMSVDLPSECSDHAHDFLSQCFTRIISERPGASELLEHHFVKTNVGSCSTAQAAKVASKLSQVTSPSSTQAPNSSSAISTDRLSSSASKVTNDSLTSDGGTITASMASTDVETLKQSTVKIMSSPVQAECQQQQQTTSDADLRLPNASASQSKITTESLTANLHTATASTITERDSSGRTTPTNLQLKPVSESNTNSSNTTSMSSASNIHDNSVPSKSIPKKTTEPSNACMTDLELLKDKQQMQTASNALVSNLLSNFPGSEATPGVGTPNQVQVIQIFMQGNRISFSQSAPSSLPISVSAHNSLEPFAYDICRSVDVTEILPVLISNGLLTYSDQDYFTNKYHTHAEKLERLSCLVVSLNEDCVEKFLDCLSKTADYAPHNSLLKKINNERKKPSPSE